MSSALRRTLERAALYMIFCALLALLLPGYCCGGDLPFRGPAPLYWEENLARFGQQIQTVQKPSCILAIDEETAFAS